MTHPGTVSLLTLVKYPGQVNQAAGYAFEIPISLTLAVPVNLVSIYNSRPLYLAPPGFPISGDVPARTSVPCQEVSNVSNKTDFRASRLALFLLGFLVVFAGGSVLAAVEDEIRERIKNPAEVCVMGTQCAAGLVFASSNSGAAKEPKVVYDTFCFACHGTGANNSPVFGNAEAWAPRIAKGMDALYESAINGFNNGAMPPKGLCAECSDDDIKATVDYIVNGSQAAQ
jgi:cytochrome c5